MLGKDDTSKLVEVIVDLRATLAEFKERRSSSQVVTQHMNTGGHAVWLVVVMAAIIFTAAVTQGPRISDLERRMDRQQDYLNAIYQQAPQLRPLDETSVNDNHHHESEESSTKPEGI